MLYISINIDDFDKDKIIISEKTRNNVISNSDFYRFYYSDDYFNSNGIYINFKLTDIMAEKYYNKIKFIFNENNNNNKVIRNIMDIERSILHKFNSVSNSSRPSHRINEQLTNSFIKIFNEHFNSYNHHQEVEFLLKISGLWVTQSEYGLTFRFYIV